MNRRFMLIFAATITVLVGTVRAGEAVLSGGGALASGGLLVLGGLGVLGLVALVRLVYLDGIARARQRDGRRT